MCAGDGDPATATNRHCAWCGSDLTGKSILCKECKNYGIPGGNCKYCRFPLPKIEVTRRGESKLKQARTCARCGKTQSFLGRFALSAQSATAIVAVIAAFISLFFSLDKLWLEGPKMKLTDISDNSDSVVLRAENFGEKAASVSIDRLRIEKHGTGQQKCKPFPPGGTTGEYIATLNGGQPYCAAPIHWNVRVEARGHTKKVLKKLSIKGDDDLGSALEAVLKSGDFACYLDYSVSHGEALDAPLSLENTSCLALIVPS